MAIVTPGKSFTSNEIVTPANLNLLGTPTVALADSEVTAVKIADAAVTTPKLATSTQQALLPSGAIMPFARTTAPAGWLIANGDVVPNGNGTIQGVTADYTALYAAVSTNFGAAGTLPDLRGIFVRGSGGPQTISGRSYSATFAAKESDGIRDHNHAVKFSRVANSGGTGACLDGNGVNTYFAAMDSGTAASETRPANIALLYCIKI